MILSLDQVHNLANECAPEVAAETLLSIVKVESNFDPLAVRVNGAPAVQVRPASKADAAAKAAALIAQGRSVDLGLAQINSRNLGRLGLTVEAAFDPCLNLAASARVLEDGFGRASTRSRKPQTALLTAFSYYNTGDGERGFQNGYVAKVTKAAATIVPAIRVSAAPPSGKSNASQRASAPRQPWDVFGEAPVAPSFVIQLSSAPDLGEQQ